MKRYTKFAKHTSVILFLLLIFSWVYYTLYHYAYLPDTSYSDSLYSLTQILLYGIPISILLLIFSLLAIRKPKFRKLQTEIIVFLVILFTFNLLTAVYFKNDYVKKGTYQIISHYKDHGNGYVLIADKNRKVKLRCRQQYYVSIVPGNRYKITYRGNTTFSENVPTILLLNDL